MLSTQVPGLQLRTFDGSVHSRLLNFPTAPTFNPTFLHDASKFPGVGWQTDQTAKQLALISRQHVLFVEHTAYTNPGDKVRFVNAAGQIVTRTITAREAVPDPDSGVPSDLLLVTLDQPVSASTGMAPFPYLNLAAETLYVASPEPLRVFGKTMRGGTGDLQGIENLQVTGFNPSRALYFDYLNSGTNADDCYFQIGDSGSPTFMNSGGQPAIVGINFAVGSIGVGYRNYCTFVPHYVSEVDVRIAPLGYRFTPINAPTTTLTGGSTVLTATPRKAKPLSLQFDLANTGSNLTGNAEVDFSFSPGQGPDTISGPGWVVHGGDQSWTLRRSTLEPGATGVLTLTWSEAPNASPFPVAIAWRSDKSASGSVSPSIALAPSFAGWTDDFMLAEDGENDDPDLDKLVNLLEYALGGDPTDPLLRFADGGPLQPLLEVNAGIAIFTHPERSDAGVRGLSYIPEFSPDLATSFSATTPGGFSTSTTGYDPPIPGFVKRTSSWPVGGDHEFVQLRITLGE